MQPAASTMEQDQCTRRRQLGPSLAAMPAQNAEAGGGQRPGGPAPKAQQPGQILGGQDVAQEPSTGSAQEQAAWREL